VVCDCAGNLWLFALVLGAHIQPFWRSDFSTDLAYWFVSPFVCGYVVFVARGYLVNHTHVDHAIADATRSLAELPIFVQCLIVFLLRQRFVATTDSDHDGRKSRPKIDHDPASAAPAWPASPCPCACPCSRMPDTPAPRWRRYHRACRALSTQRSARSSTCASTRTEVPPGSTISITPLVPSVPTAGTCAWDLVATADVSVTGGAGTSRSAATTSTVQSWPADVPTRLLHQPVSL
jgi:hypothetical protein